MPPSDRRPQLVVVSPFIDKQHGTERCVAEQIQRLSSTYEIHLYSSRVRDISLGSIVWHRVPVPPGPEALRFLCWVAANTFLRWKDRLRGLRPVASYSPGPNCLAPDVVSVHALFARLRRMPKDSSNGLSGRTTVLTQVHRHVYYWIAECAERAVYRNSKVKLAAVSSRTAKDLRSLFGRDEGVSVIYHGVETARFSPERRSTTRAEARKSLGLADDSIAILLIGNDWEKKGLTRLITARAQLRDERLRILVVGSDSALDANPDVKTAKDKGRLTVHPARDDVEFYYAAADIYASPSLEDAFALPVLEAMACGLPVITSSAAGVSEIIRHGEDGFILADPRDAKVLAGHVEQLSSNPALREKMGQAAARTAANYTWDRNAEQLRALIEQVLSQR